MFASNGRKFRQTSISLFAAALLVFSGFAFTGCAGSETSHGQVDSGTGQPDTQPAPDTEPPPPPDLYKLTIVGWQKLTLQQGQQVTLQVRLTRNEESAQNHPITFAFRGDAKDSTLSTYTAMTDKQGFAETTLTAGQLLGTYQVEAKALKGTPVSWDVEVLKKPDVTPPPPKLVGTFSLDSAFDIQGQFNGSKLADVLNILEEISNDPEDPGKFIVDIIVDQTNEDTKKIVNIFKPLLYTQVQALLNSLAPKLVADLKTMAQNLSSLARRFEIKSSMISPTAQDGDKPMTVTHRLDKIAWTLNGTKAEYTFAQLGMGSPEVTNLTLQVSNQVNLAVAQHSFDLKFGAFILAGLNNLVIPLINKNAKSINDLLNGWVSCDKIGKKFNETVKILGESFWTGACSAALQVLSTYLENEIIKIDQDTSKLTIQGQAKLTDDNADGFFDTMTFGLWTGTFTLNTNAAVIAGPGNAFTGKRTN